MPYNVRDFGSIRENGSVWVPYEVNRGQNRGAQYAQGIPQTRGAHLISTDHAIELVADGRTGYGFRLENVGTEPTSFTLGGGSVV
jgi:hypothetical protein